VIVTDTTYNALHIRASVMYQQSTKQYNPNNLYRVLAA